MFSILVFNLALLHVQVFGIDFVKEPYVDERFEIIPKEIVAQADADVLAFQEVFSLKYKKNIADNFKTTHPYVAYVEPPFLYIGVDVGLMILSKHPIKSYSFEPFEDAPWTEDVFAEKGVMSVTIEHPDLGDVNIINTHTTAGGGIVDTESAEADDIRMKQLQQLIEVAKRDDNYFIVGDFNSGPAPYGSEEGVEESFKAVSVSNYEFLLSENYQESLPWCKQQGHMLCDDLATWDPLNPMNDKGNDYFLTSPAQRIDHVFVSKEAKSLQIESVQRMFAEPLIQVTNGNGKTVNIPLSDHYGMKVLFKVIQEPSVSL